MHVLVTSEFNGAQRIKAKVFQDEGGICQYLGEGSMEGEEIKGVRDNRLGVVWWWWGKKSVLSHVRLLATP